MTMGGVAFGNATLGQPFSETMAPNQFAALKGAAMKPGLVSLRLIVSDQIFRSLLTRLSLRADLNFVERAGRGVAQLVLDFPLMWAFTQLDRMDSIERGRTLVVTQSAHNAYLDAIGSYHVSGVLDRPDEESMLSSIYAAAASLRTYRWRSGLTYMELRVTRLLLRGNDTSGIAELLRVSPKTVNAHVSNILTKLGYDSRTQYLAALVSQHRA